MKEDVFLPTPACVQMNATGAEYSRKSINTPPAPMTGIVVIYKSYPAECAECCVTIPNNRTDARNPSATFFPAQARRKLNMILITYKTIAASKTGRRQWLHNQELSCGDNKIPTLILNDFNTISDQAGNDKFFYMAA